MFQAASRTRAAAIACLITSSISRSSLSACAISSGYVTDLSERDEPAARIVGGQVIDAKPEPIAGIGPDGKAGD